MKNSIMYFYAIIVAWKFELCSIVKTFTNEIITVISTITVSLLEMTLLKWEKYYVSSIITHRKPMFSFLTNKLFNIKTS